LVVTTHAFTIVLDRLPADAELDALFSAGCDDAMFGTEGNLPIVEFDREAPSLAEAIVSAVRSLEAAALSPVRVVDQDLLTLADIGDRLGQSRESIRRYAAGLRGPGGFPPPVNPTRDGAAFYRWSEVAPWARKHLSVDVSADDPTLAAANLMLQVRRLRERVANMRTLSQLLIA
jgi:hypothetical protein